MKKPKIVTIDAAQILDRVDGNKDRKKVTFYLSEGLCNDFRLACDNMPVSRVIEELMKAFLESK